MDVTPPTITCPGPANLACNAAIPAPNTGSVTASDGCGGSVTVEHISTVLTSTVNCVETWTRTYRATDVCGNSGTCTQLITRRVDTGKPTVSNTPPATIEAPCGTPFAELPWVAPVFADACGSVTVESTITPNQEQTCGLPYVRVWTATDLCGNTQTFTQTITVPCCLGACSLTQGAYGNDGGNHCLQNGGTSRSLALIQNALASVGGTFDFGSLANNRYFRLVTADAIHVEDEMLPGGGSSQAFDPGGARWSMVATWPRVPLQVGGNNHGKIKNTLFAQTMVLFFNIRNYSTLGNMPIADTFWTRAMTDCGSNIPTGSEQKFSIPEEVVNVLQLAGGYPVTVNGLFALANDVLGGVNTSVDPSLVAEAVDNINNGYDECRMLSRSVVNPTGVIAERKVPVDYLVKPIAVDVLRSPVEVSAHPNPFTDKVVFTIRSEVSGMANFELVSLLGEKVATLYQGHVEKGAVKTLIYTPKNISSSTLVYKLRVGNEQVTGKVISAK